MLKAIAKATMLDIYTTKPGAIIQQKIQQAPGAQARGAEPESARVPIFISPKALTFPIVVVLVKGAWEAARLLPMHWASGVWFPFWACIVLGLLIAISNLVESEASLWGWILGLVLGSLNSLVIFGAVMGIPRP